MTASLDAKDGSKPAWSLVLDRETCTLCEVCARGCPPRAFLIRAEGLTKQLFFDPPLCDGCGGKPFCAEHCPEKAITVEPAAAGTADGRPRLLIEGESVVCASCKTPFMPQRGIKVLLRHEKAAAQTESVRLQCPACRRKQLLHSYLKTTDQV